MVSFVFQAGGLTSLLHSLKSICFLGHCRGRKPALPRAASLPQHQLWGRDRGELVLALAPLSSWETTTVLTKGKPYSAETAGINIKLKYPVVLKLLHITNTAFFYDWFYCDFCYFIFLTLFDCFNYSLSIKIAAGMGEVPAPSSL